MSATKRELEERIEQILEYLFPGGVRYMGEEDQQRWRSVAYDAALKMDKEFIGVDEALKESRRESYDFSTDGD